MGSRRRCGPDRTADREDELSDCVRRADLADQTRSLARTLDLLSFLRLISGLKGLKSETEPADSARATSQISSLLGELQDGADVR
jgi:hypothetical protein